MSEGELYRQQEWLLADLTDFVSRFYFTQVSNQLQALELFDRMSSKLLIQETFREVVAQSEFVSRVLSAKSQAEETKHQGDLARVAHWWLPVGVAASLLGVGIGVEKVGTEMVALLNKWVPEPWGSLVAAVVSLLGVLGVVFLIIGLIKRRSVRRRE